MPADFLPASVAQLRDPNAIALLQQLQRRAIQVPLQRNTISLAQVSVEIATAYVHQVPTQQQRSQPTAQTHSMPIVLLHGFDSSLLEFRRLFPLLAAERDTWAIDLFGSGFTEYSSHLAVTPQTIRQHLHTVVADWIGEPVMLVGSSLGGAVAIDFALNHPGWVRSLVLINSVGFSGSFPLGQFLASPVVDWGVEWLHFRKQTALAAAMAFPGIDPILIDAIRCSLLHQEMPGWKAATASFTQSGGYANLGDRISQVQQPTLIMWGDADDTLGTTDAKKFEQAISGSTLHWIKQAGHSPHFDQPQQVADVILSFQPAQ